MSQDAFIGPMAVGALPSDPLSPGAELPYSCTIWQGNDYRDSTQGKIQHEIAFTKQLLDNKAIKEVQLTALFQAARWRGQRRRQREQWQVKQPCLPVQICYFSFMQWEVSQGGMPLYLSHSASLLLPNPILPNSYKLDLPQFTCRCLGQAVV